MGRKVTLLLTALAALAFAPAFAPAFAAQNAPARIKAFSRLPDWSGMWVADNIEADVSGHFADGDKEFRRLKFAAHPPYNAAWEADYQKRLAAAGSAATKGCVIDFPATMESPQPFELIATPEETIYTGADGTYRHIYTDGRGHPADLWPTITGHSIGHWEGQTLVVDTVERTAGPDKFLGMAAYSDKARFSERIRMTGKDTLEDQMTIEDPVAFTRPWTVTLGFHRVTYIDRFDPYYCEFDKRIDIQNGKEVIKPAE